MSLVSRNIRYMRIFEGVPRGGGVNCQTTISVDAWAREYEHEHKINYCCELSSYMKQKYPIIGHRQWETKLADVGMIVLIVTFISAVRWSRIHDMTVALTVILVLCRDFRLTTWFCVTAVKISVLCVISAFERSPSYTRKPCCGSEIARCRCKTRYVSKFTAASRGSPRHSTALVLIWCALLWFRSLNRTCWPRCDNHVTLPTITVYVRRVSLYG